MITIYNTMTQKKEEFKPLQDGKVRMYVCGITTYDYCHLGHARMLVVFDMVVRYLRVRGFDVTYIRNITDIDDKILARADENNELFSDLTERFIKAAHEDEAALRVLPPDQEPRATHYIDQIVSMIESLVARDFAYKADNGDVYYAVNNFPNYGKLSKKNPEDLLAGARIEVGELKRDPRDFALWKTAGDGNVGWDSPWGYGRPGWHIECSAMSTCCLGDEFDIHGGGSDLMFPHHENEIAQTEAVTGKTFAKLWMHNGPLRVDDEKMSKSLGNFFTIREVLKKYDAEVVRHLLIASHYRSPINYAEQSLKQSIAALERLYTALKGLDVENAKLLANSRFEKAFYAAMDDDFNTPEAFGVLFEIAKEINRQKADNSEYASQLGALLLKLGNWLGMLETSPEDFLQGNENADVDPAVIDQLIAERDQARADKDWQKADQIRDQLAAMKVILEDGADGSSWRIER
ncbi:MAG: cysteine--tRNA ligase [Gammaproteobacteria bacterium]|nr:cysteine--tRNA ligase [Gammaproteobacteria bacterium]MDP6098422.1 cysteine--tRNA ligase [Gammaproteobacteria bacterium]MDP7456067.1 cysteine--tRNA ligase [Gammaproteobacteria bacterium]